VHDLLMPNIMKQNLIARPYSPRLESTPLGRLKACARLCEKDGCPQISFEEFKKWLAYN
jgi:hypothetical protein